MLKATEQSHFSVSHCGKQAFSDYFPWPVCSDEHKLTLTD